MILDLTVVFKKRMIVGEGGGGNTLVLLYNLVCLYPRLSQDSMQRVPLTYFRRRRNVRGRRRGSDGIG